MINPFFISSDCKYMMSCLLGTKIKWPNEPPKSLQFSPIRFFERAVKCGYRVYIKELYLFRIMI